LLTGLTLDLKDGDVVFRPRQAEPGAETVLGVSYGGGEARIEDIFGVLDDLSLRPETAAHVAGKLAVHFVADRPPPDLVAAMVAAYRASDGLLAEVYRAMLAHPAAWSERMAKVRQPLDFIGAGLRALGIGGDRLLTLTDNEFARAVGGALNRMGQPFLKAPGPDGWKEEAEHWLTPQGLASRIGWAMKVPQLLRPELPDPAEFARSALGDAADPALVKAVSRAETRTDGVGLVLASPAFNRR